MMAASSDIKRKIYVSTNAFRESSFASIIENCRRYKIYNIELSYIDAVDDDDIERLTHWGNNMEFQFLIHNYFPMPRDPFVLNLASHDKRSLALSLAYCQKAVDLSAALHAPFYSVHAGFCFSASPEHLGRTVVGAHLIPKEEARRIFIGSLQNLADYARKKNVCLAIENHVVEAKNLVEGENKYFLGATAEELLDLLTGIQRENVGLLVDLGHLKISANTLGISPENFIRDLSPKIMALHFHENDGIADEHSIIFRDSWFWKPLHENLAGDIYCILEVKGIETEEITRQVQLISSMFYDGEKDYEI
jgi:sugar phosphate isomerase/epimerase